MNSIKSIEKNTIAIQIKSMFIFDFLNTYNQFERIIRSVFESHLETFPQTMIQKLYFYYGGKIGSYIEYEESAIQLQKLKYKEKESFSELSTNQLLKICKSTKTIEVFDFQVISRRSPVVIYPFYDCAIKLLNMRNKLAHEIMNTEFKEGDLIELIATEQLKHEPFSILQNYDIENMDNMTQYIASNLVFMKTIVQHLLCASESNPVDKP